MFTPYSARIEVTVASTPGVLTCRWSSRDPPARGRATEGTLTDSDVVPPAT